ncbi:hypothetical protein QBC47DRAFT_419030 [Echria macrotheca]|uniref:DUF1993 domain-containing protein n=1 Tax=Echria macrotheca TaxID=438768 RepID=A0AAJ0BLB1_9PEZI|nr:hypothetical protein QBC47DRAFT_419030 [Echria macrotheca]
MSSITFYESSVDQFIRGLEVLKNILQKAIDHAPEESATYPAARLYEDMNPLSFQVQNVSNLTKKFVERLLPDSGLVPTWEDKETTMSELQTRVDQTMDMLRGTSPETLRGVEDKIIELKMGKSTITLSGKGYTFGMILPQVIFHVSIAYAILRSKGVPVGKRDFLNKFLEPQVLTQTDAS